MIFLEKMEHIDLMLAYEYFHKFFSSLYIVVPLPESKMRKPISIPHVCAMSNFRKRSVPFIDIFVRVFVCIGS